MGPLTPEDYARGAGCSPPPNECDHREGVMPEQPPLTDEQVADCAAVYQAFCEALAPPEHTRHAVARAALDWQSGASVRAYAERELTDADRARGAEYRAFCEALAAEGVEPDEDSRRRQAWLGEHCRAYRWKNAHPRFAGPHGWHFFHYGDHDEYMGSCAGSG